MPNVYTRTGDKGTTGLYGGGREKKNSIRVEAYGTTDETNSAIGVAKAALTDQAIQEDLTHAQERLFYLGAELASSEKGLSMLENKIMQDDIDWLEAKIDSYLKEIGPFTFVTPGVNESSAALHQARTIARRAERRMVDLDDVEKIRPELLKYINRLSDFLFTLARVEEEREA